MKRKELIKKIAVVTLSTMVAGNLLMTSSPIYAEPILAVANDMESVTNYAITENDNNEEKSNYSQIGAVESFQVNENIVTIKMVTGEQVRVSLLGDDVFRLYMDPTGDFQDNPTPNDKTHTTTIRVKEDSEYEGITPQIEDGDILKIATNKIELRVEKATGKMELVNKETGKTVWKEAEALKYKENEIVQTLETNDSEYFYGGGMQNGRFSHKGKSIYIRNENIWTDGGVTSPTPFYWSTNGYGVMRHTFKQGKYEFASVDKSKVTTKHSEGKFDAYYFIDQKPNEILNGFYELTGKPALLPEYAFYLGHANCYARDWVNDETGQESQTPQPGYDRQETLMVDAKGVVDAHLNNDMPLGWFLPNDGYGCGYGREDSIDGNIGLLKEFVDYTKSNGIQTGLWTQSQLKPTGNQDAYLERDIDKEVGVAGTNAVKTDVAWVGPGYSFALNSVRQSAEGILNNSVDNARPFVITVDGWAGTQRYSSVWSGDQFGGEWEYIRFHIPTYIG
ncbi:TIM-barrel domain-containing protein, partial [Clostridium sp.]|uniref:TIM-barrel domain-containing protein n=1 Tax=Clostridium sp. TaxID=1506 RepID=UPI003F38283D